MEEKTADGLLLAHDGPGLGFRLVCMPVVWVTCGVSWLSGTLAWEYGGALLPGACQYG